MNLIYFISFAVLLHAATLISQHKLSISVTGGYNIPAAEFKGDLSDSSDRANTYGIKNGFNIGLMAKYGIDRKNMIKLLFGLYYNSFSGEGNYFHGNNIHQHNRINIFSLNVGTGYSFISKGMARPFIELGFTTSFIGGEKEINVTAHHSFTEHEVGSTKTKLKTATRFGLAVSGGVDLVLSRNMGVLAGIKYNMSNIIGKQFNSSAPAGEFNLNDKENGLSPSKNIDYIQIYAGISFYFLNYRSVRK
jgi:opacity protein-like surface antigen